MKRKFRILGRISSLNYVFPLYQPMKNKLIASDRFGVKRRLKIDEFNKRERSNRLMNDREKQINRLYKSL